MNSLLDKLFSTRTEREGVDCRACHNANLRGLADGNREGTVRKEEDSERSRDESVKMQELVDIFSSIERTNRVHLETSTHG